MILEFWNHRGVRYIVATRESLITPVGSDILRLLFARQRGYWLVLGDELAHTHRAHTWLIGLYLVVGAHLDARAYSCFLGARWPHRKCLVAQAQFIHLSWLVERAGTAVSWRLCACIWRQGTRWLYLCEDQESGVMCVWRQGISVIGDRELGYMWRQGTKICVDVGI